jgi:hypothetical protein
MLSTRRQFLSSPAGAVLGVPLVGALAKKGMAAASLIPEPAQSGAPSAAKKPTGKKREPAQRLDTALFLDVEDIFSPPQLGNDESIRELATILTEEGLRANFMVIADRALVLKKRGRKDVIDSLGPHEVGLHTRSARHPEVPEYVAGKSWEDGVAECLKREREGTEIIRDVFGKSCVSLSTHNVFTAPHSHRVAAILGLPFVYAIPAAPPLYNLSWYAGALGLPWGSPTLDNKPILAHMEEFDEKYPDDKPFEAHLRKIDRHLNICMAEGQPYFTFFLIHPQRVRLKDFIDNYWCPNGVNYPEDRWGKYGRPRQYSPEEVGRLLANFRRLARWIRNDPRLNVMTVPELMQKYGKQPAGITRAELADAARRIATSDEILMHPRFSPAEILAALAHGVVASAEQSQLPDHLPRIDVLGPTRNPIWIPELQGCSRQTLVQIARQLLDHTKTSGYLPATLGEPLARVGINHLYRAFAETYMTINSGSTPAEVRFRRMPPWPQIASAIGVSFMKAVEGELMDPDAEVNTLYRDGKLQTWTLKPAVAI